MKIQKILFYLILSSSNILYATPKHIINPKITITHIDEPQAQRTRPLPYDISFLIADMKFDGTTIKVLEFGEGTRSYFKGHEALYGNGKIWDGLWRYLEQFKSPMWYIGSLLDSNQQLQEISFSKFNALGGNFAKHLHKLQLTKPFNNLRLHKNVSPESLPPVEHTGIIILRDHTLPQSFLNNFSKAYPHLLVLNQASAPIVSYKHLTAKLFDDCGLQHFKPQWKLYPKSYSHDLARKIFTNFPTTKKFVIKPLDSANGWGVLIVRKKELDITLRTLFSEDKGPLKRMEDMSYRHWATDHNKNFLIEAFAPSKPITINQKQFDATMRMVFILDYDEIANEINLTFLGDYWKLPGKALDDEGTLTELHKSKIVTSRESSVMVDPEDRFSVMTMLGKSLPKLYQKMIERTFVIP